MIHDTRKDKRCFSACIEEQKKRILKFEGVFQTLDALEDRQKLQQCALYLLHFYRDLFSALYSCGESIDTLRQTFQHLVKYAGNMAVLTWSDATELLALSILLEEPLGEAEKRLPAEDALICALCAARKNQEPTDAGGTMLFPDQEAVFLKCLRGESGQDVLRDYLKSHWREDNQDAAWYGAEKRNDNTCCGYWCYLGAAIAKIRGFDPDFFIHIDCFPLDLCRIERKNFQSFSSMRQNRE